MKSLFRATLDKTRGVVGPLMARRNESTRVTTPPPAPVPPGSYAAVTIRPCTDACEKALALAHQRMLKREAPEELPLPGCTNIRCRCRLEEFDDRRAEGERRQHDADSLNGDGNRRLPGDRRIEKQAARPTAYFNDFQG